MSNSNLSVSSSNTLKEDLLTAVYQLNNVEAFGEGDAVEVVSNKLYNSMSKSGSYYNNEIKIDKNNTSLLGNSLDNGDVIFYIKESDFKLLSKKYFVPTVVEDVDSSMDKYRNKQKEIIAGNKSFINVIEEKHNYYLNGLGNSNQKLSFGQHLAKPLFSIDIKSYDVEPLNNWVYSDKEFGESEISKIKSTIIQYLVSRHSTNDTFNKDILKEALPIIEDILQDVNAFKKMLDDKINNN